MRAKHFGTSHRALDESRADANLIDSLLSSPHEEYANKVDMFITP